MLQREASLTSTNVNIGGLARADTAAFVFADAAAGMSRVFTAHPRLLAVCRPKSGTRAQPRMPVQSTQERTYARATV